MSFGTPESHGFCLPPPPLPDTGGPMQQLIAVPGGGEHLRTAGGRGVEAGRGQAEAPGSAAERLDFVDAAELVSTAARGSPAAERVSEGGPD